MNTRPQDWIALLRAIGPLTHKKMSMVQFRTGCEEAGLKDVRTVLATGNALFSSALPEAVISHILSDVIRKHDLQNEVFLRQPSDLAQVLAENPFPEASVERPNHMLVFFMSEQPVSTEIAALENTEKAEQAKVIGREAYVDYKNGVAGSKLTSGRLETLLRRSGTARNWNTIRRLVDMASS